MSLVHQLFLQTLREIADFGQPDFDAYRMPLVGGVLEHMARNVPAYGSRLAAHMDGARFDLDRWTALPLLHADEIARLGAALAARALPPPAEEVVDSPFVPNGPVLRRSLLARTAQECERELAYEANALDLAASLAVLHGDHAIGQGVGWSITFAQSPWLAGDVQASAADQLGWLRWSGASILRTTALIALHLAQNVGPAGVAGLEAVIVADNVLTDAVRAEIEQSLRARVVHVIEHPVLGYIAASDPAGGYSVSAGSAVAEIVDVAGRPTTDGAVGELVLTPLYEYALPFLRFATGIPAAAGSDRQTLLGVRKLSRVGEAPR